MKLLKVSPIVKYAALSFFEDRFYPCFSRFGVGNITANWLLHPVRKSNLQLFALASLWISSKIHNSRPLSIKSLKSLGDKVIIEQHFTNRDFLEAGNCKSWRLVNFEACMDIMDLLYEKEMSNGHCSPCSLAASTLLHMSSQFPNKGGSFLFFLGALINWRKKCIEYEAISPPVVEGQNRVSVFVGPLLFAKVVVGMLLPF